MSSQRTGPLHSRSIQNNSLSIYINFWVKDSCIWPTLPNSRVSLITSIDLLWNWRAGWLQWNFTIFHIMENHHKPSGYNHFRSSITWNIQTAKSFCFFNKKLQFSIIQIISLYWCDNHLVEGRGLHPCWNLNQTEPLMNLFSGKLNCLPHCHGKQAALSH